MGILLWIILGALAGWIASVIMSTDAEQGTMLNIIVGIVGAMIGGVLFNSFGEVGITGFNLYSLFVAVVGSAALLGVVKLVRQ